MIIKGLHFAENALELVCLEDNGRPVFASIQNKPEGMEAAVTDISVFDLILLAGAASADSQAILGRIEGAAIDTFPLHNGRLSEAKAASPYALLIKTALYAFSFCSERRQEGLRACEEAFLKEYLNQRLEFAELPDSGSSSSPSELPADRETLFRQYLTVAKDLEKKSVFHDMDEEAFEAEKAQLQLLCEAVSQYEDYEAWKKEYLESRLKLLRTEDFTVCRYIFMKTGEYEEVLPKEAAEGFEAWVNSYPNAFVGGFREACEDDLIDYISLNAAQGEE